MISERIESNKRFPWGAMLCCLAAVVLAALAPFTGKVDWLFAAVPPLLLAAALWLTAEPYFAAEFHENGIEFHDPPRSIPYANIEALQARKRPLNPKEPGPSHYPIELAYDEGLIRIPARLNVPSDDVFRFLYALLPLSGSREIHPMLQEYLSNMEQTFGADKVWTYRTRRQLNASLPRSRGKAVSGAVLLTGLLWVGLGAWAGEKEPWIVGGICLIIFGLLFLLIAARRTPFRQLLGASLVISPLGIALVQGDLDGEMKWDELKGVKLQKNARVSGGVFTSRSNNPGISLTFEGANVVIRDCYDRPLSLIHARIMEYWR